MRQVIIVSLNNNAYHLDEEAYAALHRYMDRARAGLNDNPDVGEILADVERAISEKCAATLNSGKNVVSAEEMAVILREVGPVVEDPMADPAPPEHSEKTEAAEPKRLYRQPKGAVVEGVCMGLAEYFGVDVVIPRLLFALLTVASGGIGGGLYLIMVFVVPLRESALPKTRKFPRIRIHPAILIAGGVLLLITVLALLPWVNRDIAVGVGIFGLSLASGLMPFFGLLGMVVIVVVVFVVVAKVLSQARTKQ